MIIPENTIIKCIKEIKSDLYSYADDIKIISYKDDDLVYSFRTYNREYKFCGGYYVLNIDYNSIHIWISKYRIKTINNIINDN